MLKIGEKGDTLILTVSVKASARRERIAGEKDASLMLEVTAPPVEGKANRAVALLIARSLGVAPSRVTIVGGEKSKTKRVAVSGVSREALERLASVDTTRSLPS
jgi:uncharacterized protein (TIGR00251 family)